MEPKNQKQRGRQEEWRFLCPRGSKQHNAHGMKPSREAGLANHMNGTGPTSYARENLAAGCWVCIWNTSTAGVLWLGGYKSAHGQYADSYQRAYRAVLSIQMCPSWLVCFSTPFIFPGLENHKKLGATAANAPLAAVLCLSFPCCSPQ